MGRKLRFTKEEIIDAVLKSKTYADAIETLGYSDRNSGGAYKILKRHIKEYDIDISHFSRKKHKIIKKICPKCEKEFETYGKRQATFCSKSCANGSRPRKYNVDGPNAYVHICWENHKRKCVVCGEDLIVEVHHYDGDHKNNDPENLVPLCSTHHRYIHATVAEYNYIIKECVDDYVRNCQ